jgi:hypothetical protein
MSRTIRLATVVCLFAGSAGALLTGCSSSSSPDTADAASSGPPLCESSKMNAYDTYKQAGFLAVNSAIFANVGAEVKKNGTKNLGASFTEIGGGKPGTPTADNATVFEAKLGAFLIAAYGGPASTGGYSGSIDLTAAHEGLDITQAQYDYFLNSIVIPALKSSGVMEADISSCFAPAIMDGSAVNKAVVTK